MPIAFHSLAHHRIVSSNDRNIFLVNTTGWVTWNDVFPEYSFHVLFVVTSLTDATVTCIQTSPVMRRLLGNLWIG